MKKDLSRNTQGIRHFLNLKEDFERNSDRLFNSLPLFYRVMYIDQPNPWVSQINRFDFIRLAVVSKSFNLYQSIELSNFSYKRIKPYDNLDVFEIDLNSFFQNNILKNSIYEYSVHDFIMGIAYNGGIHMKPDRNIEKSEFLYENLFVKEPDISFEIAYDIAKVLIDIYDELHSLLSGDSDGHSPNINFQAKIIDNGIPLDGIYFEHAYMQFPIRAKKHKGIRFCFDIKLLETETNNPILWYGHRQNSMFKIGISQNSTKIIIQIFVQSKPIKTIITDISDVILNYFLLEVAIYPDGKVSLAVNNILRVVEDLEVPIEIIDGKVILGSDLSAKKFGTFFERMIVFQSIDRLNVTRNLGVFALQNRTIEQISLPYNLVNRII